MSFVKLVNCLSTDFKLEKDRLKKELLIINLGSNRIHKTKVSFLEKSFLSYKIDYLSAFLSKKKFESVSISFWTKELGFIPSDFYKNYNFCKTKKPDIFKTNKAAINAIDLLRKYIAIKITELKQRLIAPHSRDCSLLYDKKID